MKTQAVEKFKVSFEMRDLNVKFSQKAFIKGFELCEDRITSKFPRLNLDFLVEGAPDKEVGPSAAATDLHPTELAIEDLGLTDAALNSSAAPPKV